MTEIIKRHKLSDQFSLYSRKYFLGPLFIIIGVIAIVKWAGFLKLIGLLLTVIGVFYLLLRKVEFDQNYIYFGGRQFSFKDITKLSALEINFYYFPYIEVNDNGRKRRVFTDSGEAGLLRILLGIIFPSLDPMKYIKLFKKYHEANRN